MKRILYLASVLPNRSETFVYREILALRRLGFEVETASVHAPRSDLGDTELDAMALSTRGIYSQGVVAILIDVLKEVLSHPIRSLRTFVRLWADVLFSRDLGLLRRLKILWQGLASLSLAQHIRPREVGHIHAHFAHVPSTIAMYSALHLDIGFSFTGHAVDLFPERSLLREKIQRARFVSCISEWHRDLYRSIFFRSDEDLVVVRCGVDTDSIEPTPDPNGEVFEIVSVGRLVEKKGFKVLLQALSSLSTKDVPRTRLTLVGDGPMRAELEALAATLPGAA